MKLLLAGAVFAACSSPLRAELQGQQPTVIKSAKEKVAQLKSEVEQAESDKIAAEDAMAKAKTIRTKEAAAMASQKAEFDSTMKAVVQAVAALEEGVAGGFLQTDSAQILRDFLHNDVELAEADREALTSFLARSDASTFASQSGQIIRILEKIPDTMSAHLAEATRAEEEAIQFHGDLVTERKQEVDALIAAIKMKLERIGELGVEIIDTKEDFSERERIPELQL
eukprot:CAMPEP_0172726574 /NCGR_PEP_ID=MMETSP1074-20121228/91049_1 /TAXON_ID=2916 /ORGANISM="Ceratium fusus, Strain PA161109" /LENGTH=225 /DNA_ID=CAMNT_0013553639 /DNA_START=59 /DNA_END=736 /DNA_ORIENTATION=+